MPLNHPRSNSAGIYQIADCPTLPSQAPFTHTWAAELMPVLYEWWGTPAVLSALHASNYYLRWAATNQVGTMGEEASAVVPVFMEMLGEADPGTRSGAADALGKLGPPAVEAVPALMAALKDDENNVQFAVVRALGNIGPAAQDAVPMLINLLDDPDYMFDIYAAEALVKITGQGFGEDAQAWRQWWNKK